MYICIYMLDCFDLQYPIWLAPGLSDYLICLCIMYICIYMLDCFTLGAKRGNYSHITTGAAPSYVQKGNNATEYDIVVRVINCN